MTCLTLAGQRIAAAEGYRGRLRAAGHAVVIAELDLLLTVMARYACDGLQPSGAAVTSPVPTRQEVTNNRRFANDGTMNS